jgi:hypothetical protein
MSPRFRAIRPPLPPGYLWLLKSPFLLRQLMLRPPMDTLPGDDAGNALAPPYAPNVDAFARRAPVEILALWHQLAVLQRTRPRRVSLTKTERWLWVMRSTTVGSLAGARR